MKLSPKYLPFVFAAGLLAACGRSDEDITNDVRAKLATESQVSTVSVATKDKVVTLGGTVATSSAKSEAERLARDVKGVKSVEARISVQEPAKAGVAQAESSQDRAIRNSVQAKLNSTGAEGVSADVHDGVVTLRGDVPRPLLTKVMQAAHEANPAPKRVDNQLNIQ